MVPASLQRDLPRRPPGTAISHLCSTDFSRATLAKFHREGRRQLKALKEAFRRYPERGVKVTYDGYTDANESDYAVFREVWSVEKLVNRELNVVKVAEDIDDLPASEVLSACEKRYVRELQALKRQRD